MNQQKIEELKIGNFTNDKALKGKYKGKFRKRAGDYRIIYLKENNILPKGGTIIHSSYSFRCDIIKFDNFIKLN